MRVQNDVFCFWLKMGNTVYGDVWQCRCKGWCASFVARWLSLCGCHLVECRLHFCRSSVLSHDSRAEFIHECCPKILKSSKEIVSNNCVRTGWSVWRGKILIQLSQCNLIAWFNCYRPDKGFHCFQVRNLSTSFASTESSPILRIKKLDDCGGWADCVRRSRQTGKQLR